MYMKPPSYSVSQMNCMHQFILNSEVTLNPGPLPNCSCIKIPVTHLFSFSLISVQYVLIKMAFVETNMEILLLGILTCCCYSLTTLLFPQGSLVMPWHCPRVTAGRATAMPMGLWQSSMGHLCATRWQDSASARPMWQGSSAMSVSQATGIWLVGGWVMELLHCLVGREDVGKI